MIKKAGIFLVLLVLNLAVSAQKNRVVLGKIFDAESKEPIESVHIKVLNKNVLTKSNRKGEYQLVLDDQKKITLVYSHISYEVNYEPVHEKGDTVILEVRLKRKMEALPEFEFKEGVPEVVFKSAKINIADYEFFEDNFLFLVYGKRLNKESEIYLVDENEDVIAKHFVPGEPVELYKDYLGNVNLICKRSIYRVDIHNDKISIFELPLDDFNQLVKPIVDTMETSILFSDFLRQFPRFKYFAFNKQDTSVSIVKEVVHKDMDWRYNFEYHFLSNADKQFAKRMAKKLKGFNKYDVAASMTGFSNSFLYEAVYAPLFVIEDTINIFDHSEGKIWKFIEDTVDVGFIEFSYHRPKKKNSWKRRLVMDEVNGKIHAVFQKNGYYYLKEINPGTGEVIQEKKLTHQFVSKIKIKDGYVYYTFKPKQILQKKFLYREKI
jgi:hypothetical protein